MGRVCAEHVVGDEDVGVTHLLGSLGEVLDGQRVWFDLRLGKNHSNFQFSLLEISINSRPDIHSLELRSQIIEAHNPPTTASATNNGRQISTNTTATMNPMDNTVAVIPRRIIVAANKLILICSSRAAKDPLVRAYSRTPRATNPIRITTIQMLASPKAFFARPYAPAIRGGASPG